MRRLLFLLQAVPLLTLPVVGPRADASSILYNTTDLGSGFNLQTNPDGSTYGVTNAAGTATYAFDKSPVTSINIPSQGDPYTVPYWKQTLTMQSGSFQVGVKEVQASPLGTFSVPSFATPTNVAYGYFPLINNAWIGLYPQDTVRDLNAQGQAVGQGVLPETIVDGLARTTYAAFSAVGLVDHGGYAPTVDNLNNYITPLPGVTLDLAVKIDDLGRILAAGTDGQGNSHGYLLTPVALGEAATVPEPTTLATLAVLGLFLRGRIWWRTRRI